MRRMVYILIAVAGLMVAIIMFAGCVPNPVSENPTTLTGLSLSQNHMNFGECYSFYLREEEGRTLFDAEVRFTEEPYCIILESCEVDVTYLDELRKLDKEYSISDYVNSYRKPSSLFVLSDETVNRTTVYLSDDTDKSADTKDEHVEVLYNFFFALAKSYEDKSIYTNEE